MTGDHWPTINGEAADRRMLAMACRIQSQLGEVCPPGHDGAQRILHFLRGEFQTGMFAEILNRARRAEAKMIGESGASESYDDFLAAMTEIVGPPPILAPEEHAEQSVRSIALRFFEKFNAELPLTSEVADKIEDALRAELEFGVFFSAAIALRHLVLDLQKASWTGAEEARGEAGEIEQLFRSLSSPRHGSPGEEVYRLLLEHEAAQRGKEFGERNRADFEIRGSAPHQWVVHLDPDRPIDANRPWEKPRANR